MTEQESIKDMYLSLLSVDALPRGFSKDWETDRKEFTRQYDKDQQLLGSFEDTLDFDEYEDENY